MYLENNTLASSHLDHEIVKEQKKAQLNEFFKKYIKYSRKIKHDYYSTLKDNSFLSSTQINYELSEHFVYYDDAPMFWVYENPATNFLHKIYNLNVKKLASNNPQKLIIDYYSKWVLSNNNSDSKYFALSVIKLVRDSRKNAFNLLLHATILAYDKDLFDPETALLILDEAEEVFHSKGIEDSESFELLYITKLFKGFVYYKIMDFTNARAQFEEALNFKGDGVSGQFHLALSNINLGQLNEAFNLVRKIYHFDLARIGWAISTNSRQLFEYFLEEAVCRYFFLEEVGYEILPIFERSINDLIGSGQVRCDKLREDIIMLKDMKWYKEKGEMIGSSIVYIENFLKYYSKSENIFILESIKMFEEKFVGSIRIILDTIENEYNEKLNYQLRIYDLKIQEDKELKNRLTMDLENSKARLEEKKEMTIKNFEYSMDEKIKIAEERIKHIDLKNDLNPTNSFKNSMMYTLMLALLVLLLGGFAEYSNSYVQDLASFQKVISVVLVSGSKWGVLTFFVGIFISMFLSASTSLEKNRIKQSLVRDFNNLKDEKQRGLKRIKEDSEQAVKTLIDRNKNKLESCDLQIKELQEKRSQDEAEFRNSISSKIKAETQKLIELANHYK
ncbi:MAG: hypothetical protein JW995_01325 [Melioribacteraceae bacterium]|nr:hypothetical protein [Melioribacteraceae bacterium]